MYNVKYGFSALTACEVRKILYKNKIM